MTNAPIVNKIRFLRSDALEKALKLGLANGASAVEHFGPKAGLLFEPEMAGWLNKL